MRKSLFTLEELAEIAAADAEIDDAPITQEEIDASRRRDKAAVYAAKDNREQKIAENQRAYREANREKIAENQRAYYKDNPEKYEAHKAYMREYAKKRYAEKKKEAST